jgi:hypothetical protein
LIVVGNAVVDMETRRVLRAAVLAVVDDVGASAELVALAQRVLERLS